MKFIKFPSIESLAHVARGASRLNIALDVNYGAKIKLHGTNAAVHVDCLNHEIWAQSRSRAITPQSDNYDFAKWVETKKSDWKKLSRAISDNQRCVRFVVYGEWAGPGIQQKDAVTKIERRIFFPFALYIERADSFPCMISDPETIREFCITSDDLVVLPWIHSVKLRLDQLEKHESDIKFLNAFVEGIGENDPFIEQRFNIKGPGEGLVLAPLDSCSVDEWAALTFKAKAEHHRVKKTKEAVSKNLGIPTNISEFADQFVTDARLYQIAAEFGSFERKEMSAFLKAFGNDVRKESIAELEVAGMEWKNVAGVVSKRAAQWYLSRCAA